MADQIFPRHGGDLGAASAAFGEPADGWLDLSTCANPTPYPVEDFDPAAFSRFPGAAALSGLLQTARRCYGLPDTARLIATPGSEIAIRRLPMIAPGAKVAIVGPTYTSHAEAWAGAGHDLTEIPDAESIAEDATVTVICNPNNPDGTITPPSQLADIARRMALRGGVLVVDEAYADTVPHVSLIPDLQAAPAVILRSFGKFFGLPGLRLGFAAGPADLIQKLQSGLGDWPVSTAALEIGTQALADHAWQTASRRRLGDESAELEKVLSRHGLVSVGGTSLFRLVAHPYAEGIYQQLGHLGVLARLFPGTGRIRFGLPPGAAGLERLSDALARIV